MDHELLPEVNKILAGVDRLSNNRLYFRDDLEILVKITQQSGKFLMLEELSFHAKFSNGLLKVIQRKDPVVEETFFLKASSEYKDSLQKVVKLLEDLLKEESNFIRTIFKEKYLELNQQCLSHLNNLCSDLSYLKLYFNDLKDGAITEN
jgi:TfoX/Sxy family transcriptional regulator of competence genes